MGDQIVSDIKAAIEGLAADGRVVVIDKLVINVASGGGARVGSPSDTEVLADEVRRTGDRRLLLRYLRMRRETATEPERSRR